jgi:hypothetical protein
MLMLKKVSVNSLLINGLMFYYEDLPIYEYTFNY